MSVSPEPDARTSRGNASPSPSRWVSICHSHNTTFCGKPARAQRQHYLYIVIMYYERYTRKFWKGLPCTNGKRSCLVESWVPHGLSARVNLTHE